MNVDLFLLEKEIIAYAECYAYIVGNLAIFFKTHDFLSPFHSRFSFSTSRQYFSRLDLNEYKTESDYIGFSSNTFTI